MAVGAVSVLLQVRDGGRDEDEGAAGRDEDDATAGRDGDAAGHRLALLVTGGTSNVLL